MSLPQPIGRANGLIEKGRKVILIAEEVAVDKSNKLCRVAVCWSDVEFVCARFIVLFFC